MADAVKHLVILLTAHGQHVQIVTRMSSTEIQTELDDDDKPKVELLGLNENDDRVHFKCQRTLIVGYMYSSLGTTRLVSPVEMQVRPGLVK